MERLSLTRSNPRRSRFTSPARALLPFLDALSLLSIAFSPYTTSVDEVCLTRGSIPVYYQFPLVLISPPSIHPPLVSY